MTPLGFINYYLLQFFCIRIAKHTEDIIVDYRISEISFVNGGYEMGSTYRIESQSWYSIMYWVMPLSGYGKDYKYLGSHKAKYLRLTKNKNHNKLKS